MKPGSLLHRSKPYAHVILPSKRGSLCEHCFKAVDHNGPGALLRRCSACTVVYYCSVACQKEAWTFHKLECKCLKRVPPPIPDENILLLLRLVQRYQRGDHKTVSDTICGRKRVFTDLVHHVEKIKDNPGVFSMIQCLLAFVGASLQLPHPDELLKIISRMFVNSCYIFNNEGTAGIGLYLGASAIDHSCRPTAVIVMEGTEVQIRNITEIPDVSETYFDKIRLSYIEPVNSREERRAMLSERYYFMCDCPMCSDHSLDALMHGVKCPKRNCDGPLIRQEVCQAHVCSMCDEKFSNNSDVIENYELLMKTTKSALLELEELKNNGHSKELFNKAEELLKLQENTFHKINVYRVKVQEKALDGALELENMEKALEYALSCLEPYKLYYPQNHPKIGILLWKIGTYELSTGLGLHQLEKAMLYLQQAEAIFAIAHGRKHSFYKSMMSQVEPLNIGSGGRQ